MRSGFGRLALIARRFSDDLLHHWSPYREQEVVRITVIAIAHVTDTDWRFNVFRKANTVAGPVRAVLGGEPTPASVGKYFNANYRCTHGVWQESRSEGSRATEFVRFTGCDARFLAEVFRTPTGAWGVKVRNEVRLTSNVLCFLRIL